MPADIINLEDLVPGLAGKTFKLPNGADEAGETTYDDYHVPGDLDTETVFEFLKLFEDMVKFRQRVTELQTAAGEDEEKTATAITETMASLKALNDSVKAKLLTVFQIANPELKTLPFGSSTTMVVLGEILQMMGIAAPELPLPPEEGGANPPNRATRRAAAKRGGARKKTTSSSTTKAARRKTRPAA